MKRALSSVEFENFDDSNVLVDGVRFLNNRLRRTAILERNKHFSAVIANAKYFNLYNNNKEPRRMGESENTFANFTIFEGTICHIHFGDKIPDKDDYEGFFSQIRYMLHLGNPFCLFIDASSLSNVSMSFVWKTVKFIREIRPLVPNRLLATSIVIENMVVKTLLEFVFKAAPPTAPMKIVGSHDKNTGWEFLQQHSTAGVS